jgi:hypothetical protein
LARTSTSLALRTLRTIAAKSTNHSARVQAAIGLLDRGWGKPAQTMDISVKRTLREMSDDELMAIVQGAPPMLTVEPQRAPTNLDDRSVQHTRDIENNTE